MGSSLQSNVIQGNIPILIERLCERFLDTTLPAVKDRLMPYVRQEIAQLDKDGKLEVSDMMKLAGELIWDATKEYWKGRL
jgi:hypothetical protein